MIIPDASRLNSFICDSFSLYVKTHISDKLRFSFELDIFSYFLYITIEKFEIYDLSDVSFFISMQKEQTLQNFKNPNFYSIVILIVAIYLI